MGFITSPLAKSSGWENDVQYMVDILWTSFAALSVSRRYTENVGTKMQQHLFFFDMLVA